MKKYVTLKMPITREKTFRGKYSGRVSCRVGQFEIVADCVESLESEVSSFIERRSVDAAIGLARSQQGNIYITHETVNGGIETVRPTDQNGIGVVPLRCVSYAPQADIKSETESYARHLVDSGQ